MVSYFGLEEGRILCKRCFLNDGNRAGAVVEGEEVVLHCGVLVFCSKCGKPSSSQTSRKSGLVFSQLSKLSIVSKKDFCTL